MRLEVEVATASGDIAERAQAAHRLAWVSYKLRRLDVQHEMLFDYPGWDWEWKSYGSLHDDAIRALSPREIKWNEELRREERAGCA